MSSTSGRAVVTLRFMSGIHVRAVFGERRTNAPRFLAFGKGVYSGLNAGAATTFSSLAALLPNLQAQLNAVDGAQQNVRKIQGGAAIRKTHVDALYTSLDTLRVGVQALADASPEQATVIVNASGFKVAAVVVHPKAILECDAIGGGIVKLDAHAKLLAQQNGSGSRKVSFNWQSTLDGKTFTSGPSTPISRTSFANLPPLTEVGFRVSVTDSRGMGAWTQVVYVLVR